jgi:hypothetical protein
MNCIRLVTAVNGTYQQLLNLINNEAKVINVPRSSRASRYLLIPFCLEFEEVRVFSVLLHELGV